MKSEVLTVGDVCESVSQTYRGIDEYVVTVNTSDVLDGVLLNHEKVKNSNLKGQFKKSFQKDDILYSEIRPANKRCALIKFEDTACYVASTKLMVLRAKQEVVLPEYLYAFLTSQPVLAELQHLAETRSGTFPQITFSSELAPLSILCPPLATQRKIAAVLSSLDDKTETNNAICRNLEEQADALFIEQFSPRQHGKHMSLYEYADYINGSSFKADEYSDEGMPIIKIAELKSGLNDTTLFYQGKLDKKVIVNTGDILFSWSGNPMTSIDAFIWTLGKGVLNQHIFKVQSKYNCKWFTYMLLRYFKPDFVQCAGNKQTTGLGHVTVADLKRLTFPFSLTAMQQYENQIATMMERVLTLKLENLALSALRDTLLPRLMSGELDVSAVKL